MVRLVSLLLFLVFVDDDSCAYRLHLGAPMAWVTNVLLVPSPIKIRPFDLIMLVILIMGSSQARAKAPLVAPMRNALFLMLGTTVFWLLYGLARGGEFRFATWQTYLILSTVLVAFTVAATFRTPADFCGLGKWLLAAAIYRAAMCWISYFTWGREIVGQSGAYLTDHDDTIIWVDGLLLLIVHSLDRRSFKNLLRNGALMMFFMIAIQWNSRRLAWVSLMMGLVVLYAVFPFGAAKRRINRMAMSFLPVIVLYVAVGWGRQERIFLPLKSLSSVSTKEDASTLARNAENLGLIATANTSSFVMGAGWGKPYIPLTMKYDISSFELWQYVPHNSILGLLAFTGVVGFVGFWTAIPTSVFLNARVARMASVRAPEAPRSSVSRRSSFAPDQLYGDMGIFFIKPMYVLAVSYAMALRMPRLVGVWGGAAPKAAGAGAAPQPPARTRPGVRGRAAGPDVT